MNEKKRVQDISKGKISDTVVKLYSYLFKLLDLIEKIFVL